MSGLNRNLPRPLTIGEIWYGHLHFYSSWVWILVTYNMSCPYVSLSIFIFFYTKLHQYRYWQIVERLFQVLYVQVIIFARIIFILKKKRQHPPPKPSDGAGLISHTINPSQGGSSIGQKRATLCVCKAHKKLIGVTRVRKVRVNPLDLRCSLLREKIQFIDIPKYL